MSDIKYSSLWAIIIVLLTALAFTLDFNWFHGSLPGYKILAWPGIIALRFFSEEMLFLPKLAILLTAQYVTYFFAIFIFKKGIKISYPRTN